MERETRFNLEQCFLQSGHSLELISTHFVGWSWKDQVLRADGLHDFGGQVKVASTWGWKLPRVDVAHLKNYEYGYNFILPVMTLKFMK